MASDGISDASRVLQKIPAETKFRTIDSRSLSESFYRGEGNATFVIYLPNERKVLRLKKSDPEAGDEPSEDDGEARVRRTVNFHKNVISGLMGIFTTEPEIVRCNSEDLKEQLRLHEPYRPAKRRRKTVIETFATILPDYTLLPMSLLEKVATCPERSTFCIEIKPKEGYVENSLPRGAMCQYCSKRYSEIRWELPSSRNRYCPCDLFSGNNKRIIQALRGLVDWPGNNFRIFKNGKLVWGEEYENSSLDEILCEWFDRERTIENNHDSMIKLIAEALIRQFPVHDPPATSNSQIASNSSNERVLPTESILEMIQRVQNLYRRSVDSIYNIYSKYSGILNDEMIYSQNENAKGEEIIIENKSSYERKKVLPSVEELRELRDYLVYRISRDCSILMAFREFDPIATHDAPPPENVIRLSNVRYFVFNNAITDLDPKSVHCIEKHRRKFIEPIIGVSRGCLE